ncbi:MAG: MoaD/ThiS family protein [Methanosarcinales archaeon Met12]|nr:MAG: MoaD/ThiS family protein [Methanosarcinales archaeon Met12]
MVKVKFFATFREATNEKEVEMEAHDIAELLRKLVDKYGKKFEKLIFEDVEVSRRLQLRQISDLAHVELHDYVKILVNGKSIELLDKLKTRLDDNDTVAIFPPVGGG